tara:strand:+ start:566 stop:3127 length:2562 start_codon:yes stop_codon:yes gene_type:complete
VIPRRLRIRNFLSYRDCEVDFSGLHVATLAGRNGDGKSALLDAITWSLWGEARGRVEDDRIRHGATEMRVELEFEVDRERYKVIRKRTRGRSGALDFFQLDSKGEMRPITGGTNRETQSELNRRVHMDHQTFINSILLVQGRSNEFTMQTPSKRKEVLRKVLGLERYEELSRQAHERRRVAAADAEAEIRQIEVDQEQLEDAPDVERALARVSSERSAAALQLENEEKELAELKIAAAEYDRQVQSAREATKLLESREAALSRREQMVSKLEADRLAAQQTLAGADAIEKDYEELRAARADERKFAVLATLARDSEDLIKGALAEIAMERQGLETRISGLEEQRERMLLLVEKLPSLREEEAALKQDRLCLSQLDEEMQGVRESATDALQKQSQHANEAGGYRARAQELKEREETLSNAEGEALCPVCRKPLAPEELHNTIEQYRSERRGLGEQYKLVQATLAQTEATIRTKQDRVAELEKERITLDDRIRSGEQSLAGRQSEALTAERDLPDLNDQLGALRQCLTEDEFLPDIRTQLVVASEKLSSLEYDQEVHARVKDRLGELEPSELAYNQLGTARAAAQGLTDRIAEANEELLREETELNEARAALTEAQRSVEAALDVSSRLQSVQNTVAESRDRLTSLHQDHGRLEERQETLERITVRIEEGKDRHSAARDAVQLYEDLSEALGRNGVQAMLIEQSLPQLERMTNLLLGQLSEGRGRTQVSLSTQRENASGKTVETLDIQISDDLGTRDYEMFSGGEKFRVDFALRIALSRLLALRSGATLATLIIDEGFGTQDEDGRDRLVAAINEISSEFRLILLVTHIDELRESFSQRIQVTKDSERGSQAMVL